MGIMLHTQQFHVKDSDGNMHGIDILTDKTTEQRIAEIDAAAQQKISELDAKAQDVLDHMPDIPNIRQDLTTLQNAVYTKEEVNGLISALPKFAIKVVAALPTTNISSTTIYLVNTVEADTGNLYTEYIYAEGKWELLGIQTLDLSGYVTKEQLANAGVDCVTMLTPDGTRYTLTIDNDGILTTTKMEE